jgi:hypothetical protein
MYTLIYKLYEEAGQHTHNELHVAVAWSWIVLLYTCVSTVPQLWASLLPALCCSSFGAAVRRGHRLRWNADRALLYIWSCLGQLPLPFEEHHQVVHLH